MNRLLALFACVLALLTPTSAALALGGGQVIPAAQTFNLGRKTPAGYGGCSGKVGVANTPTSLGYGSALGYSGATVMASVATTANNLNYVGTGRLQIVAGNDGSFTIDSHNCLVPAGAYGAAPPAYANAPYTLAVSDGLGNNSTVTVNLVANRWDVTNIDTGANADTSSSTQLSNVLQSSATSLLGGNYLQIGDSVVLRAGTVIGSMYTDTAPSSSTTAGVNHTLSFTALRVTKPSDGGGVGTLSYIVSQDITSLTASLDATGALCVTAVGTGTISTESPLYAAGVAIGSVNRQVATANGCVSSYQVGFSYSAAPPYAAGTTFTQRYTAQNLPANDWIPITADVDKSAVIRHLQLQSSGTGVQQAQGYWFKNLVMEIDYAQPCSGYVYSGMPAATPGLSGYTDVCPGMQGITAPLTLGVAGSNAGATFVQVSNSLIINQSTRSPGQRGQVGVGSICTSCTIGSTTASGGNTCTGTPTAAFYDNGNYPDFASVAPNARQQGHDASISLTLSSGAVVANTNAGSGYTTQGSATAYNTGVLATGFDYSTYDVPDPQTPNAGPVATGIPSGMNVAGTYTHVSGLSCTSQPSIYVLMNGLDMGTGIYIPTSGTAAGSKEIYIHDNTFAGLFDGLNLTGNFTNTVDPSPTDFFIIGNKFDHVWNIGIQTSEAAPVYSEWNTQVNFPYATGFWHNDCEIDTGFNYVDGKQYDVGKRYGNLCVRAYGNNGFYAKSTGLQIAYGWSDGQGWYLSNIGSGTANPVLNDCYFEGNTYIGTFVGAVYTYNCNNGSIAFNTILQDPVGQLDATQTIYNLGQWNGSTFTQASSGTPLTEARWSSGTPAAGSYAAFYNGFNIISGNTPTGTIAYYGTYECNKDGIGYGVAGSNYYAAYFVNSPSPTITNDFTNLQMTQTIDADFQPSASMTKCAGAVKTGPYWQGAGAYFNYTNRTSTAPF